jgi:alkaline phosphatase D
MFAALSRWFTPVALAAITVLPVAASAEVRTVTVDEVEDRRWIGAAWQPSRLQDWRIDDGRLVNDDSRLPVRTAHALSLRLDPKSPTSPITISTTVRPVGEGKVEPGAFAGILLGAGGPDVDPRLTALVQQVPAPDGGLLAVVDGSGDPRFLDFSTEKQGGFSWTLPNKTSLENLQPLAGSAIELANAPGPVGTTTVSVTIIPKPDDRYDLRLQLGGGDMIWAVATAKNLSRDAIDGGLALVSHRGPRRMDLGWSFDGLRLSASDLASWVDDTDHSWGPVLATAYTLDRTDDGMHDLRLTALFPPLAADDLGDVTLEVETRDGAWRPIATGTLEDLSFTVRFAVPGVDEYVGRRFRVVGACDGVPFERIGGLHAPPEDRPIKVAVMSCVKNITAHTAWNRQGVWYPHDDLVERVAVQKPDFYFFAGDQIYEGDVTGVDFKRIVLDYHTKYQRWLRSFGELFRDRPVVIIPDDHDVYHGNIWGAGGIKAEARDGLTQQDAGGYKLNADVVNAIHRTQVGNLPDCMVPGPIGQGIEPYTTRLRYGPIDCAIVADRMWKDSASVKVPAAEVRNGWFRNLDFDPKQSDVADAEFLGPTQEAFLEAWSTDRDPRSPRKLVLSQTPWVNVATLPPGKDDGVVPGLKIFPKGGYAENDVPAADTDSGGWPQGARLRAVRSISDADALHLAGDQHLGSLLQYGVDGYRDGAYAFTPPAVGNTWPRRWMPIEPGANRWDGAPRYAGDYEDGFGNLMTVYAVTNPEDRGIEPRRLHDLSPGYGIVEIDAATGDARLECWPRWGDARDDATQYEGFPYEVKARR